MPGTSRHHWGTEIDLNALNNKWFENGKGLKVYQLAYKNAAQYGFHQPYTAKNIVNVHMATTKKSGIGHILHYQYR